MGYIRVPIETNPDTLAQDIISYIQTKVPNWIPNDANLDTWIIRAVAAKAAENRTLASDVPDDIFASLGASLFSVAPIDAVSATADTTWTLIDTNGHTIPAGTNVGIVDASGTLINFVSIRDVVVAPGDSTTAAGEVAIMALDPGVGGSGLTGTVQLIDVLDWVSSVALVGATSGGVDAETNEEYLDRLNRRMSNLSTVPILPPDFAEAAREADPGVFRAVAIDLYDPVANTYGHARTVTVAAVDKNGAPVSNTIKTNIINYISALREVNFVINVMDPHTTQIDVAATVIVLPTFDPSAVHAAVVDALTNYLNPANWGLDPATTSADAATTWIDQQVLYYNELIALVSNVTGVDRVSDLTVNIHGNAPGRVNINLTGPASLTTVGDISAS